jgi:hypothetical protein
MVEGDSARTAIIPECGYARAVMFQRDLTRIPSPDQTVPIQNRALRLSNQATAVGNRPVPLFAKSIRQQRGLRGSQKLGDLLCTICPSC